MTIRFQQYRRTYKTTIKWGLEFFINNNSLKRNNYIFGGEFSNSNPFLKQLNLKPYDN